MKVLLIVDMQKGFITNSNKGLIENINFQIKSGQYDKIVATKFINKENSNYIKKLNWNAMFIGEETDFAIDLPKNAIIIEKTSYGLPLKNFSKNGTELVENSKKILDQNDDLFICGTDYDACVLAIAYQMFDNGYNVSFLNNCIGSSSRNPIDKKIIERILTRNFGAHSIKAEELNEKE